VLRGSLFFKRGVKKEPLGAKISLLKDKYYVNQKRLKASKTLLKRFKSENNPFLVKKRGKKGEI